MLMARNLITVSPEKIRLSQDWRRPKSVANVEWCHGLLQFFWQFIPKFANITILFTNPTKRGSEVYNWTKKCKMAYHSRKTAITFALILISPDQNKTFREHLYALQSAVEGILAQCKENDQNRVKVFFLKHLSPPEQNDISNSQHLLVLLTFLVAYSHYPGE